MASRAAYLQHLQQQQQRINPTPSQQQQVQKSNPTPLQNPMGIQPQQRAPPSSSNNGSGNTPVWKERQLRSLQHSRTELPTQLNSKNIISKKNWEKASTSINLKHPLPSPTGVASYVASLDKKYATPVKLQSFKTPSSGAPKVPLVTPSPPTNIKSVAETNKASNGNSAAIETPALVTPSAASAKSFSRPIPGKTNNFPATNEAPRGIPLNTLKTGIKPSPVSNLFETPSKAPTSTRSYASIQSISPETPFASPAKSPKSLDGSFPSREFGTVTIGGRDKRFAFFQATTPQPPQKMNMPQQYQKSNAAQPPQKTNTQMGKIGPYLNSAQPSKETNPLDISDETQTTFNSESEDEGEPSMASHSPAASPKSVAEVSQEQVQRGSLSEPTSKPQTVQQPASDEKIATKEPISVSISPPPTTVDFDGDDSAAQESPLRVIGANAVAAKWQQRIRQQQGKHRSSRSSSAGRRVPSPPPPPTSSIPVPVTTSDKSEKPASVGKHFPAAEEPISLGVHNESVDVGAHDGSVDVGADNGSVDVGAHNGSVDVGADNGSVDVGADNGSVDVGVHNGSVDVGAHNGSVDVGVHNGSVDVMQRVPAAPLIKPTPLVLTQNGTQQHSLRSLSHTQIVHRYAQEEEKKEEEKKEDLAIVTASLMNEPEVDFDDVFGVLSQFAAADNTCDAIDDQEFLDIIDECERRWQGSARSTTPQTDYMGFLTATDESEQGKHIRLQQDEIAQFLGKLAGLGEQTKEKVLSEKKSSSNEQPSPDVAHGSPSSSLAVLSNKGGKGGPLSDVAPFEHIEVALVDDSDMGSVTSGLTNNNESVRHMFMDQLSRAMLEPFRLEPKKPVDKLGGPKLVHGVPVELNDSDGSTKKALYTGPIVGGKFTGFGSFHFEESGDTYKGEVVNGKMHGLGTITLGRGSKKPKARPARFLRGTFKNNVFTSWGNSKA